MEGDVEIRISTGEIRKLLEISTPEFPKYVTQLLNLANQNAQATRPRVVGQMSELIREFTGRTLDEWEAWYLQKHPDAMETATKKIMEMLRNFRDAMDQIDENMVRQWVRDLVIVKTYIGLKFQQAILRKIAEKFALDFRASTPEEESQGIDGFIGGIPISLKPVTYRSKKMLSERIGVHIVFYEKRKGGIRVILPEALVEQLQNVRKRNG